MLKKRSADGNFEPIWERPCSYFEEHPKPTQRAYSDGMPIELVLYENQIELSELVGAAISPDGSLVAAVTKKSYTKNINQLPSQIYYYIQFHKAADGEKALEYKKASFTLYKSVEITEAQKGAKLAFISPQYVMFSFKPNFFFNSLLFDGKGYAQWMVSCGIQTFMHSKSGFVYRSISTQPWRSKIFNYQNTPHQVDASNTRVDLNKKSKDKVVYFPKTLSLFPGLDTQAVSLAKEESNYCIRRYELAGKWAEHLKELERIDLQQTLLLHKLINTRDESRGISETERDIKTEAIKEAIVMQNKKLINGLPKKIKELVGSFVVQLPVDDTLCVTM